MPLPPSGDPGDGHGEDDPLDSEFRPPLPPEDRIWRHPSEVAGIGPRPTSEPSTVAERRRWPRRTAIVAGSGVLGAGIAVGAIALTGGFEPETRVVERQVAVQSVSDDQGVAALASQTSPSVAGVSVTRDGERHTGTAVVVRSDGILVTNAHLVDGADEIGVRVDDRPVLPAEVLGTDERTDLAVLRVDARQLEPAAIGSTDDLAVGDEVVAMGLTDDSVDDASIDRVMISALDRRLRAPSGTVLHGMILLDDPLPGGVAGGPLLDMSGAVIGITSVVPAADGEDDPTFGVATPVEVAMHAADDVLEFGRVRHVWLGIEGTDLSPEDAAATGLAGGATVHAVVEDSPAQAAGIDAGDVVTHAGGDVVRSMSDVITALRMLEPGDGVDITVRRGDTDVTVTAVLAERDDR